MRTRRRTFEHVDPPPLHRPVPGHTRDEVVGRGASDDNVPKFRLIICARIQYKPPKNLDKQVSNLPSHFSGSCIHGTQ